MNEKCMKGQKKMHCFI